MAPRHRPEKESRVWRPVCNPAIQKLKHNFIIVGPSNDPAHVRDTATAVDAFKHFAAAGALFVSRADDSGTNIKELELWQTAGITTIRRMVHQVG